MEIRFLDENDYPKLVKWWEDNRFPPVNKDFLPENGTGGIMVQSNGRDVCCGFIYFTNSKAAWIEWIVADFNYREEDRGDCIKACIMSLTNIAKQHGFKYIYASLKSKSLANKYHECGFSYGDSNAQEMVMITD